MVTNIYTIPTDHTRIQAKKILSISHSKSIYYRTLLSIIETTILLNILQYVSTDRNPEIHRLCLEFKLTETT